ncbi:hypothetical protein QVD17_05506 [Tagetes erecta]|uniref:Uncharacterized protein n=1 Tax=Tagetes erecta TaxID=13708 RepID=A0AAD8LID3_TARER|nr:hypothetical protein QVD17_05506 [Tagetes erecta]
MCGAWGLLDGQLSWSDDLFRCDVTQAPRIGLCAAPGESLTRRSSEPRAGATEGSRMENVWMIVSIRSLIYETVVLGVLASEK